MEYLAHSVFDEQVNILSYLNVGTLDFIKNKLQFFKNIHLFLKLWLPQCLNKKLFLCTRLNQQLDLLDFDWNVVPAKPKRTDDINNTKSCT
jgi:hypothetical protein